MMGRKAKEITPETTVQRRQLKTAYNRERRARLREKEQDNFWQEWLCRAWVLTNG